MKLTTKDIEKVLDSLSESFIRKSTLPFDIDQLDFENINPDAFWYKNIYESRYCDIEAIRMVISKKTNPTTAGILVNYQDLLWVISNIFKTNAGHTCSTDKASVVLKYCLKRSISKGDKSIARREWVILNGNLWYNFVVSHPLILSRSERKFIASGTKLFNSLDLALSRKKIYQKAVIQTLLSFYPDLEIEVGFPKRSVRLREIFNADFENAFDWAKHTYPWLVLKIKKSLKRKVHSRR
mgnify:CR=1 FL=1